MAEQIISKKCSKCKQIKVASQNPEKSEFGKNRSTKDGFQAQCKICRKDTNKHYSQSIKGKENHKLRQKRYTIRHPERVKAQQKRYCCSEKGKIRDKKLRTQYINKYRARKAVNHAIEDGKLPRPDTLKCHYCPNQAEQYHHHKGYAPEYWLDVVPACVKCHSKIPV